jgi:hypothetical protein
LAGSTAACERGLPFEQHHDLDISNIELDFLDRVLQINLEDLNKIQPPGTVR